MKLLQSTQHFQNQLQAEKFNEVIHVDFCELGPSDTGHLYVLVAKDGLTQFVQLTMYKSATALDAAVGLLDWCKTFGIPSVIVSDGGPHFKNSLVKLLARELTFEHHLTVAHSPCANGSVERLNRSMLAYFRKSLSQLRVPLERWPELLPYVQYIHNTTPSPSPKRRETAEGTAEGTWIPGWKRTWTWKRTGPGGPTARSGRERRVRAGPAGPPLPP